MKQAQADQLLVARVKDGDHGAFSEIVSLYWDRIFARAYQLLKNREDAEEVTQDTFIRAQKGLASFRGDAAFSTWLCQIATNLAHNRSWYWWRRKRSASFSLDQTLTEDSDSTLADVLPADGEDPGEATLTQEFIDRVSHCMKDLNDKHREILVLRNVHNLSYEEIAEELRISVGTVKSRIARARESLREQMGSDFK
ncbi:MAG: sigma-70 family RNA polymerase sigma factor [Verrucomicrobiota bacterium]